MALDLQPPLEAQLAAIADDVAYTNHDLDDGLRAGFLALDELAAAAAGRRRSGRGRSAAPRPGAAAPRARDDPAPDRRHGSRPVDGARRRLAELAPAARRRASALPRTRGRLLAARSQPASPSLREFLRDRVYRHYKVSRMTLKARRVVRELAEALLAAPDCLPDGWRERAGPPGSPATAATVRDYIAGMTDRFALDEHDRLFKLSRDRA